MTHQGGCLDLAQEAIATLAARSGANQSPVFSGIWTGYLFCSTPINSLLKKRKKKNFFSQKNQRFSFFLVYGFFKNFFLGFVKNRGRTGVKTVSPFPHSSFFEKKLSFLEIVES